MDQSKICPYCNRQLASSRALGGHLNAHRGEKMSIKDNNMANNREQLNLGSGSSDPKITSVGPASSPRGSHKSDNLSMRNGQPNLGSGSSDPKINSTGPASSPRGSHKVDLSLRIGPPTLKSDGEDQEKNNVTDLELELRLGPNP